VGIYQTFSHFAPCFCGAYLQEVWHRNAGVKNYQKKIKDSKIQRFKNSKIQRFKNSKIQKFPPPSDEGRNLQIFESLNNE